MAEKFLPHVERLEAVAISASGLIAIGGRRDVKGAPTSVTVATLPKIESVARLEVGEPVLALAFVGDHLCAGDAAGNLHVWDTASEMKALAIDRDRHQGAIRSLAAFGSRIASVGDDGVLAVSEISSAGAGETRTRALSVRALRAVAVADDGGTLAAGGDDGVVRSLGTGDIGPLVDARDMNVGQAIAAVTFLGDGRIAAGCADGSVRIAFLEGAAEAEDRAKDAAHTAGVRTLIHTPELTDPAKRLLPRRLLSISEDGDLKAWQVDTRRKPPTTSVSSGALCQAVLIPGSSRAKAERRGGTLAIVDRSRTLSLIFVNEEGVPDDSVTRVHSRFEEIAEQVKSKKDEVRVEACSALAGLPEDEARKALDRLLGADKSPTVRRAAAANIAHSDRRLSRPALREALSDSDKKVREAALRALEKVERDTPIAAARAAVDSRSADMRVIGVGRLPALRESSPLVPTLIARALSDSDADVRAAALDALYALERGTPLNAARTALARGPADIRREVLVRIGRERTALSGEGAELIEGALDDADESVRTTAFLTSIAARAALAHRVRAVDAQTGKAIAELESKGAFADSSDGGELGEEDLKPLFAAMACRAADTALRAARLLGLFGDPRATGALLQLSREADAATRRAVVEALMSAALSMPSDGRVLDRLRWLIDDVEETVRQASFDVLQLLGEAGGARGEIDLAALALRASAPDIRVRALPMLIKFGGNGQYSGIADLAAEADELLGDALDDEHDKVRGEAFRTLWAWNEKDPRAVLERAARCRQPEVRRRVVKEIPHQRPEENAWADELLLALVADHVSEVGLDAYAAATKPKGAGKRVDVHRQAMSSASAAVRVRGLEGAPVGGGELIDRIVELCRDDKVEVHTAAIEALDRVDAKNAIGFAVAFAAIFYGLRVRAMELCGRRRDERCVEPVREFLAIPDTHVARPTDELRQRAAAAIADCGARSLIDYYTSLLDDGDPVVREMASRGLATACAPGDEGALLAALGHEDLPVRSWIAEGLARLGDDRALPVLAGTLAHHHLPIRRGAIMGFVALGPDGVRGILKGLDDDHREIQDLVFAVIVARDLALSGTGEPPDLLLSALSATHPEIRYAAARILEARGEADHQKLAAGLVGPQVPDKASEKKDWPSDEDQKTRIGVLVEALASDHPLHRYAATQVLTLRAQPLAFWREAKNLLGPSGGRRPRIPFTNWDREDKTPRKRGWIRSLFRGAAPIAGATSETLRLLETLGVTAKAAGDDGGLHGGTEDAALAKLVFGTYAGLVRQAPGRGDADETHRVRRDSIERLAAIAANAAVGHQAVLPVLRRALSDPHHMVRRGAVSAVRGLYRSGSLEPLRLELSSAAADVGRGAVDELVAKAGESAEAMALAKDTINAPMSEVRGYGLTQLPQLFESGSLEPWLLALESRYADVRLQVVDRLVDSSDERVLVALARAMESDHEDLRLKAAAALAGRGDVRTVDVLAGLLQSEDSQSEASEALVELAHARVNPEAAAAATLAIVGRLENDPDKTADQWDLLNAIERIGSPAAADYLVSGILSEEDDDDRDADWLLRILVACSRDHSAKIKTDDDGNPITMFADADGLLPHVAALAAAKGPAIRRATAEDLLRYLPGRDAEELIEAMLGDRVEEVRVAAASVLTYRARNMADASIGALHSALREGRRELVLPAAEGLAARRQAEAFQPLLLVFKAGEQSERKRAVMAMGALGDQRALEELELLIEGGSDLEPEDAELVPDIVEAFGRMLPQLEDDVADRIRAVVEDIAREGSDDLRKRAFRGLRRAGDDRAREFIEAIAADTLESGSIRGSAIAELGELASPRSESVLADIIRQGEYSTGSKALDALTRIFPEDKTRTQLLALASSDSDLSGPAAGFLSWFGDVDTLVERLTSVTDVGIRARLRQGLIRRGACPTDKLRELLASDSVGDRADAAWIVGASGATELGGELAAALARAPTAHGALAGGGDRAHAERVERAIEAWLAGLWAAGRVGADGDDAARAAIADDSLPQPLRLAATRHLADHGSSSDAGALEALLGDRHAEVRSAAAAGLARLAPESSARVLEAVVVADGAALRPVVQAAIAAGADVLSSDATRRVAIGTMIGDGRINELSSAAESAGTEPGRLAAIAALGRLGGDRAESVLSSLLENASEADEVRAATFRALRRLQRAAERSHGQESA